MNSLIKCEVHWITSLREVREITAYTKKNHAKYEMADFLLGLDNCPKRFIRMSTCVTQVLFKYG